jgi:hypothetical protein
MARIIVRAFLGDLLLAVVALSVFLMATGAVAVFWIVGAFIARAI